MEGESASFLDDVHVGGFAGFDFDGLGEGVLREAGKVDGLGGKGVGAGGDVVELERAVGVEGGGAAPGADAAAGGVNMNVAAGGVAVGFEDLALERAGGGHDKRDVHGGGGVKLQAVNLVIGLE